MGLSPWQVTPQATALRHLSACRQLDSAHFFSYLMLSPCSYPWFLQILFAVHVLHLTDNVHIVNFKGCALFLQCNHDFPKWKIDSGYMCSFTYLGTPADISEVNILIACMFFATHKCGNPEVATPPLSLTPTNRLRNDHHKLYLLRESQQPL